MLTGYSSHQPQPQPNSVNIYIKDNPENTEQILQVESTLKRDPDKKTTIPSNSEAVPNSNQNITSLNGLSLNGLESAKPIADSNNINDNNNENGIEISQAPNLKQEETKAEGIPFNGIPEFERSIRIGFIRKVYGILTLQLLITFGLVCLTFITAVKSFIIEFYWIFYIAAAGGIAILLLLVCGKNLARKVPLNYFLLFFWTLFEAYMLMYASAYYDYQTVLSAIGITIGLSIGLTVFACFSKINFSYWGSFATGLLMMMLMMIMFGFLFSQWLKVIFCTIGVFVFSLYILYDTYLILGKFSERYEIDDYIIGALNIYMDIVNLFLMLLCILGALNRK